MVDRTQSGHCTAAAARVTITAAAIDSSSAGTCNSREACGLQGLYWRQQQLQQQRQQQQQEAEQ